MNKFWIFIGFIAIYGVSGCAAGNKWINYDDYSEEIEKDYPHEDEGEQDKLTDISDTIGFKVNLDEDGNVIYDDAYEHALKMLNNATSKDLNDKISDENNERDDIDDYQIEDNRSEVKEYKLNSGELVENIDDIDPEQIEDDDIEVESTEHTEDKSMKDKGYVEFDKDVNLLEQEAMEDVAENIPNDVGSWQSPVIDEERKDVSDKVIDNLDVGFFNLNQNQDSNFKKTIDDAERFFNETEDVDDDFDDEELVSSNEAQQLNEDNFSDETKRILEETSDNFDEEIKKDDIENAKIDMNDDEMNKILEEINPDFSKEKNIDGIEDAEDSEDAENAEDAKDDGVEDAETKIFANKQAASSFESEFKASSEKYNMDEDTVSKAYKDLIDDVNHLRETWMKLKEDVSDGNINKENLPGFDELETKLADMAHEAQEDDDDYEEIDDKNLSKLFHDQPEEDLEDETLNEDEEELEEDDVEPQLSTLEVLDDNNLVNVKPEDSKLIKYVDDALNANEGADISKNNVESTSTIAPTTNVVQEHKVEPLEEIPNELGEIFSPIELERSSVDPVRITLNVDTSVVFTSPNFPRPYPTNRVLEWILEGKGSGIEFNVTEFALNSAAGDYVLLKPGRVDASGDDGILLAFSLDSPRLFRFVNVDRMFIRFESMRGLNRFSGFSFSAKMISPLPEERVAEPETMPIGYPESTITLNLGGVTLEGFLKIEEEFRQIVADMASMYIEANQIDPGMNTTLEVTQITSRALCFHNWPQFEQCAEVRFGVPLQYDDDEMTPRLHEEDLRTMWFTYSSQNPFALRLQRLGIMDFQIPNDNNILMVWLVIAAGVVISMAMLAFALWRFSCFEDYTRMPSFSDTESVNEKKTLDLYPTPHQTLPPLYSDTEYKWGEGKYDDVTTVDMSGFPNRSYVRTEDYDFDSEEEVVVPSRDRYTTDV